MRRTSSSTQSAHAPFEQANRLILAGQAAEIEALQEIGKSFDDIDAHIQSVIDGMEVIRKKYITQAGYDALEHKNENIMYIIV